MAEPLIVIVGETASGKSALALDIAKRFDGEIISADSRAVYKGMDIGTAKPSLQEQATIRHHLLDLVEPDEKFSVGRFKGLALAAIDDIHSRGRLPIMAGGSGLYIDAVIYDYGFVSSEESGKRDPINPRHLDRAAHPTRQALRPNTLIIGLSVEREALKRRIHDRVEAMVESGLVEEVKRLGKCYGWEVAALQAPAYKAFREYLEGSKTLAEAKDEFIRSDQQLAKRQRTWFRRNNSIQWLDDPRKADAIVTTFLNKTDK